MMLRCGVVIRALVVLLCAAGAARAQTGCPAYPSDLKGEVGQREALWLVNAPWYDASRWSFTDDGSLTGNGSIQKVCTKPVGHPERCELKWVPNQAFTGPKDTWVTFNYPEFNASCPAGNKRMHLVVKDTKPPAQGLYPQYSPKQLPYTGGAVSLVQDASDATGVVAMVATMKEANNQGARDSVAMTRSSGTPTDGKWSATWQVPANQKTASLKYYITCVARDAGGLSKDAPCGYVDVEARPDREPPVLLSFTTAPETLPASGGDVVVTAQVSDNPGVTRVLTWAEKPDGSKTGNTYMKAASAPAESGGGTGAAAAGGVRSTWTLTWPLWANTAPTPATWIIHVTAYDAAGNKAEGARNVVVAGKSAGPEIPKIVRPRP